MAERARRRDNGKCNAETASCGTNVVRQHIHGDSEFLIGDNHQGTEDIVGEDDLMRDEFDFAHWLYARRVMSCNIRNDVEVNMVESDGSFDLCEMATSRTSQIPGLQAVSQLEDSDGTESKDSMPEYRW